MGGRGGRGGWSSVPDSLQRLQVSGQLAAALLLLLQLPPQRAQLLLGLHLDVVGDHHRRLQVGLEAAPLLLLLLHGQAEGDVDVRRTADARGRL